MVPGGTEIGSGLRIVGLGVMLAVSALAILFMRRRFRVIRWEAATLIVVHVVTIPLLVG